MTDKQKKDEANFVLRSAVYIVFAGVGILITTPFLTMWLNGLKFEKLPLAQVSIPSGYAIAGIGLVMILVYRIPELMGIFKGVRKK